MLLSEKNEKLSIKALLSFLSPSNPHLRSVNCGFSSIEGLKIALVVQLQIKWDCPTIKSNNPCMLRRVELLLSLTLEL